MMHEVETYSVKELFNSDQYRIPIYQRNYAWGKAEISQLIQDILDYIPENRKYYIGTLVVYRHQMRLIFFLIQLMANNGLQPFQFCCLC